VQLKFMFIGFMGLISALYGKDFVMPWVTNQPQFRSLIVLNNMVDTPIEVMLKAVRPFGETPGESTVLLELDPFAQEVVDAGQLFAELGDGRGFAVHISAPADAFSGAFVVRGTGSASGDSPAQGNVVDRATASNTILFDYMTVRKDDAHSGLVAINAGDQAAEVQLSAYQNGQRVGSATAVIEPNRPWAGTAADLFPGISGQIYAIAESSQPLIGLVFLFNRLLEPSMANARPLANPSNAPDFEPQVTTQFGPTAAFDGFIVDDQGNIFGAGGFSRDHLVKIDPQGEVTTVVNGLGGPVHLIQGINGDLFVSEFNIHQVSRVTKQGTRTVYARGLDAPTSLAFDEEGHLWVANYGRTFQGHTISKVAPNGEVTTALDDPLLLAPIDIYFHESGDLLIANQVDAKILRATRDGQVTLIDQLPEQGIGHMIYLNGVCYSTAGNRIYKTTLDGKSEVFAGQPLPGAVDGPASLASFERPNGIWVTPDQSALLVTSATRGIDNNFIRKITLK